MASGMPEKESWSPNLTVKKFEIEDALRAENEEIRAGTLKEDNPLESSEDFGQLCEACRRGDLKVCQEMIEAGVNINARDRFDYTPLILASLCGHFEVVQLLLEAGALCERDTFQGERALYNALNDKIRNLLLSYDYSKSRDPLQPLAGHVTSLLYHQTPQTSDITLSTDDKSFHLHKFILSARSPYFAKKLALLPETTSWKVPQSIPTRSLEIAVQALYLSEVSLDFSDSFEDQAVLAGIQKLGRHLEIGDLLDTILESDRRKARQKRTEEVERGRDQLEERFHDSIIKNKIRIEAHRVETVQWDRQNSIFADVLLCAADDEEEEDDDQDRRRETDSAYERHAGIPIGPSSATTDYSPPSDHPQTQQKLCTLVPAHRAMLLRSDYFLAMFSSSFREAQISATLPVVRVDCSPDVLLIILSHLYTERCSIPLYLAIPTLFAADMFFIDALKVRAATIISTLGNGSASVLEAENPRAEIKGGGDGVEEVDIYDVIRAGWDTRVHRLEEFGARFIAYRLERYIDEDEFKELVKESAARIKGRQETDTVELVDDIRYYLSERFRLRFEDAGIEDMLDEQANEQSVDAALHDLSLDDKPHAGDTNTASSHDGALPVNGRLGHFAAEVAEGAGIVRTLDGEIAGDEFAQDAINYQILLGKIDRLLEGLDLDA